MKPRCILHGSFGKHFDEIQRVHKIFTEAGVEVLAPKAGELAASKDGFGLFADEVEQDPRLVELLYLQHLKELGQNGFSYFVNPEGYMGKSVSYELGIAQVTNTRCFYMHQLADHPAYVHQNAVWGPESLADYIFTHRELPEPQTNPNEHEIHRLWHELMVPGSIVAAGAIIEHRAKRSDKTEVLLVKTHKWGGRYSVVGGRVWQNEKLYDGLIREVQEETGLQAQVGRHICTFDQIKHEDYYKTTQHIFVDHVVRVDSKKVVLNDEAQSYTWTPVDEALEHLDIEPNARHTLELYAAQAA